MAPNILELILEGREKPTNLPLEILRKITDNFSTDREIGEGGFGKIYKGVIGNWNVAVKRIKSSMTIDEKLFRREVNSLMEANHPNVVRFLGLCSHTEETLMKIPESKSYIYAEIRERLLCFEYISNGSLDTKITDEFRGLDWDKRYQIIKGICAGLHYLHTVKSILHMDLKPTNILVDNLMTPKITDFGLSRPTENSQTVSTIHFSSRWYSPPENLFGGRMSVKSDIYSLGVIIIEMVTGRKSVPDNKNNILRRWRHRWNKSMKEIPREYIQQVAQCLEIGSLCQNADPYARPDVSDILSKFVEIESTNNLTAGQVYLPNWEDDMLGVEPLELQFGYNRKSCSVELSNNTDTFIAFNILLMNPLSYSVEPKKDIVKPRSKYSVEIKVNKGLTVRSKKCMEEFIVRSIKVNEGLTAKDIDEDMFDKYVVGHHVDEIQLTVVSEEPCSEEFTDYPIKQAKKQYASSDDSSVQSGTVHVNVNDEELINTASSSGTMIERGSVQLAVKDNKKAPLLEYNKKVMLELTGGDYTSDRPGLDLVVILDTSSSMYGEKMEQLKTAMRFVVRKLSPIDCLSIVTFSSSATKLCPLWKITAASQRELQVLIDGLEAFRGTNNIKAGLLTGLKVLADRKVCDGRIAAIMLMSSDPEKKGKTTEVGVGTEVSVGNVPVYTFGFGADSNNMVLSAVAANSMGGTFSHIQNKDISNGGLTMAFSQCLAGLLTVSVQDLELTVATLRDESRIVKVTAGTYPQTQEKGADGSVAVTFGSLYSREVRMVIVDLLLPATESQRSADILKVTYSYKSRSSGSWQQFVAPPETLTVWRTASLEVEEERPVELQREEARLQTAKLIEEARNTNRHQHKQRIDKLVEAQNMLLQQSNSNPLLRTELQELLELSNQRPSFSSQWKGLYYALSSASSHGRQRFAARGDMHIMRLFATPRMDMYLEQAKKYLDDPVMQLPLSVDDDVNEEEGRRSSLPGREEEMRRLSLEMED